jgi:hypothetical protein
MSLPATKSTSTSPEALAEEAAPHFGPSPQIVIELSPQHEDAWCYAACAEMVINFCIPENAIRQCDIASLVKQANCCALEDVDECLESGCTKDDIGRIFTESGVRFERTSQVDLARLESSILGSQLNATPPSPVEVVIDWSDGPGSHAVLVTGVLGDQVFIVDPLEDEDHGGWQSIDFLQDGFGHGTWVETWLDLRREEQV